MTKSPISIILIVFLFFSCALNETDKLLKEAETFANKKNFNELFAQSISEDEAVRIRAMAEITRFSFVIDELNKSMKDMSVKQLERYMTIMTRMDELNAFTIDPGAHVVGGKNESNFFALPRNSTIVSDASSIYDGKRPEYSYFEELGRVTVRTKDVPAWNVTVEMIIGYDIDDLAAEQELSERRYELVDFTRRYFAAKSASELGPENEDAVKREIREIINERHLHIATARVILFRTLDVMEEF